MYIGWATNVNKDILDSTNITVGEGATVEDSIESGGQKKKRLARATTPDKYSIKMAFECTEKDINGLTELERFYAWYKFMHCYGVNPFLFPAILINSNRQRGMSQEDVDNVIARIHNGDITAKLPDNEYYVIASAVEGSKSGNHLEINMTWETYATGSYSIAEDEVEIDHIEAENGYVDIIETSTPLSEPTSATWTLKINNVTTQVTACTFDGDVTTRYYFEPKTTAGTYIVKVGDSEPSTFVVV